MMICYPGTVSDTSTASSPISSPVRRGRFAVTKVAESVESTEGGSGSTAPTPALPDTPNLTAQPLEDLQVSVAISGNMVKMWA